MPLIPLALKPGVNQEGSRFTESGHFYACDMVRFKSGQPQKIGGWVRCNSVQFLGVARALFGWLTLAGLNLLAIGTNVKYYLEEGGTLNDITPLRLPPMTIGADPFSTTSGSTTVIVIHVGHGAANGDFVTFSGATGFNGLTAGDLNQEFEITVIDANSYSIVVGATPNATSSGGGIAVVAAYQVNVGLLFATAGVGWGTGTWGRGTWGSSITVPGSTMGIGITQQLRLWSQDNFGEDLVFNLLNGPIFYWDASSGVGTRAINLTTIAGASDVPTVASSILFTEDRHLVAFGTNELGTAIQDPLFIRWATQESLADWTPTITNTAGGYRLSTGSTILTSRKMKAEVLVWTDSSVYSMQFLGPPDTFGFTFLSRNISFAGPNAVAVGDEIAYWMGRDKFYFYNGRVDTLRCDLWRHVFMDINPTQFYQVYAANNNAFSEIIWFYCSANSTLIDRMVAYNFKEDVWTYGTLARSAWIDSHLRSNPQATDQNGYLYWQDWGVDDGSTEPISPIVSFIETADLNIGNGDKLMFVNRILPDVSFEGSTVVDPTVTLTLKTRRAPGSAYSTPVVSTVASASQVDPERYTDQLWVRLRGRQANFRIESTGIGVNWQLGVTRVQAREDGRR